MKISDSMNTIPKKLKVVNGMLVFNQSYKSDLHLTGTVEEVEEFSNEPVTGIKIVKGFINSFCQAIFAEDPRGFSVRLCTENVTFSEELLTNLHIDNGIIRDTCVYYYDSGVTYIVSISSDTYMELAKLTEKRDNEKALLSNQLEVGVVYRHKSLGEIIYLGKYSVFERAFSWLEQDGEKTADNVKVSVSIPYRLRNYAIMDVLRKHGVDMNGINENSPEYIDEYNRAYKEIQCVPFKVFCGEYYIFASVTKNFTFGEAKHYWDNKAGLIFRRQIDRKIFISKVEEKQELASKLKSYLSKLDMLNSDTNYEEPADVTALFYEDTATTCRRRDVARVHLYKLGEDGKEAIRIASKIGD